MAKYIFLLSTAAEQDKKGTTQARRLVLASGDLQAVDEDGVLAGTGMVLVLDTDGELELETREFPDLAPVATVQQHLVFKLLAVDVLVEDLGHLL